MSEKHQYFNGVKYTRDDKTGYYLNSNTRTRIHRAVWEHYNGKIPNGYHIHHIDGDKSNNSIDNLQLVHKSYHATMHGLNRAKEHYEEMRENLIENAIPASKEWHKSDEGHEWHKEHGKKVMRKREEKEHACIVCGKIFSSRYAGECKFCSNACKSIYRRKIGADNVTRTCECCGKEFVTNKYSKAKTCSQSCNNRMRKKRCIA